MARRDILECVHEPFGDAFYFGPEFLSDRFRDNHDYRKSTQYCNTTYKDVLDSLEKAQKEVRNSLRLQQFSFVNRQERAIHTPTRHVLTRSRANASSSKTWPTTSCPRTTNQPRSRPP